jgi:hypothetical protein
MDETKSKRAKATIAVIREPRSAAERAQLVGEYRASGLTQERFAARAGLKIGTLRAWIYKRRPAVSRAGGHFAPVRIVDALPVAMAWSEGWTLRPHMLPIYLAS